MQNNNTSDLKLFYIYLKQFYNFFAQPKSTKFITIVNTLDDNIFKYQILLSNKTVLFITTLYIFNSLIDSWYHNIKFKSYLLTYKSQLN